MSKTTYEELDKYIKELEKEYADLKGEAEVSRDSETRFRLLVENSYDIVYSVTPDGIITFISPQISRYGYTPDEVISKHFLEYVVPEQRQEVLNSFKRGTRDNTNLPTEFQWISKEGDRFWVEVIGNIIYSDSGDPFMQYGVVRDISERKELEEVLHESEEKFRVLADLAPLGIYMADTNGKCIYINKRYSEMGGLSVDEAKGDGWEHAIHPDDRETVFSNWDRMIEQDGKWGHEYRFLDSQGNTTWVYGIASKLLDYHGQLKGYVGMNIDITERKKADEERNKLVNNLQEALESIKILRGFLPICAHCKKIHDDKGYWTQIEKYISEHSEAEFSHGLCPQCMEEYYPGNQAII
ncbi:PAS domain-containing protein [candidate division KSB1 bacterium]